MDEKEIQKIAKEEAEKVYKDKGTKFGVASVPTHNHNGLNSVRIDEKDITQGNKNSTAIISDSTETVTFYGLNLSNLKRIAFLGFAANNADGSPATLRALISGEAQFGRCYLLTSNVDAPATIDTVPAGTPIVQITNSVYIDSTDLTNNRVAIAPYLAYAVNPVGSVLAALSIVSYTNNSITLTSQVETNWKIQGNLIIT